MLYRIKHKTAHEELTHKALDENLNLKTGTNKITLQEALTLERRSLVLYKRADHITR